MNRALINKFLKQQCSPEELVEIYQWLCDSKNEIEATALFKSSWERVSGVIPKSNVNFDTLKRSILDQLEEEEPSKNLTNDKSPFREEQHNVASPEKINVEADNEDLSSTAHRSHYVLSWTRTAAIIVMAIGLTFIIFNYFNNTEEEPVKYIVKSNPRGQKATIFLKDGSKVILNSESTLRYAQDFGEYNRELILDGEAFFEVAKDSIKPFRVTTQNITTTALGTSFNIRAFPGEKTFNVSLATGKVVIDQYQGSDSMATGKSFTLDVGEELIYDNTLDQFDRVNFDPKEALSWKDGIIYFNDSRFEEVIEKLERWYDVEFELVNQDKMDDTYNHIDGEFKDESLTNVLRIMSFSKDFKYTINGKNVTIEL
ncbi:DUF4974 domain-containing protein [Fulvivirgaceae bacterium BMA10]|uniref:DUF4974 domain-containing protein n=1 Tax=Splendidivirga corallicola TaxID=3051826 RepID=A0ABT8KKU8_9BACT|nr:DUF4974 domain-containing protein [Fulvivirgaceae bacterium BMA10]